MDWYTGISQSSGFTDWFQLFLQPTLSTYQPAHKTGFFPLLLPGRQLGNIALFKTTSLCNTARLLSNQPCQRKALMELPFYFCSSQLRKSKTANITPAGRCRYDGYFFFAWAGRRGCPFCSLSGAIRGGRWYTCNCALCLHEASFLQPTVIH
ncbi:hypothetical protein BDW72DRAFT_182877 [Aspergillus terricola var. indicus]